MGVTSATPSCFAVFGDVGVWDFGVGSLGLVLVVPDDYKVESAAASLQVKHSINIAEIASTPKQSPCILLQLLRSQMLYCRCSFPPTFRNANNCLPITLFAGGEEDPNREPKSAQHALDYLTESFVLQFITQTCTLLQCVACRKSNVIKASCCSETRML